MDTKYITKAGAIAAIYVILVALEIPFGAMTFGPIQMRIAEALVLLPLIERAAIPGVFIGCFLANFILTFFAPYGIVDVFGGSLVTLIAAYLTWLAGQVPKRKFGLFNIILGIIPPVLLNGLIVSLWIAYFSVGEGWEKFYLPIAGTVALGELVAIGLFGNVVLFAYRRVQNKI